MNKLNRTTCAIAVSAVIATAPIAARADFVEFANDILSWSDVDSEIIATSGSSWDASGTTLEYTVYFDADTETWKYRYEWSTNHKSVSHLIFSLTDGGDLGPFSHDDLLDGSTEGGEIKDYGPGDRSNPGIPGDMYGIKFDTDDDGLDAVVEIITGRGPMWGDFYAKGGAEMLAIASTVLEISSRHQRLLDKAENGTLNNKQSKKLAKLERRHNRDLELLEMSEVEQDGLSKRERKRLSKLNRRTGDRNKVQLFAYNAGFGEDNPIEFNPDGSLAALVADQILVPDSFEGRPPSAIPVPAAVWLFGSGLVGLTAFARRRRRS